VEKGEVAKKDIEESTKRTGVVEVWQVDLSSLRKRQAVLQSSAKLERLDIVTENAGLATPKYTEVEGMESTITVNVISTFLMALLLLPKLRADAIKFNILPRLTIVASDAMNRYSSL
jgi:retinol dehydrogenase-12